jgi:APA family basic amino acid/polyamine antiporter
MPDQSQPMSEQAGPHAAPSQHQLPRSIGVWGGAAIMVGVMIGSGIFRTPTEIAQNLGNPYLILGFWVLGGLICLVGAFTFAELATMYPRSGGIYVYLYEGFGPAAAFVFGWSYMVVVQPMALAGMAVVFAEHLNGLLGVQWHTGLVTCITIIALTALNVSGMRKGANFAIVITALKALALLAIVVLAVFMMEGDAAHFTPTQAPLGLLAAIAPVLAAVLWTYDGWSDVTAVAEEVKQPQKEIPRIFFLGTVGITLLYVAVNAAYIWLMPLAEMRTNDTVAPTVLARLVGSGGAIAGTWIILVSVLGSVHGSMIVGSRVMFAQARDGLFFSFPARVHPRFKTPDLALWLQAALACAAILALQRFDTLIEGFTFAMFIFYGLAAAAIFVLRAKRPDQPRPYRCWGYPVVPVLFILSALFMTVLTLWQATDWYPLVWTGILAGGVPVYYGWRAAAGRSDGAT